MRKLIKIVIVLSVNMLYLSLSSTKTKAEEVGALKINNQVIYQDNQQKKNVEVNFIIPDLFLPIKAREKKKSIKVKRGLSTKQKMMYLGQNRMQKH